MSILKLYDDTYSDHMENRELSPSRRVLVIAALVCSAYSIVNLMVNGVIVAESVESAQVITGTINYPAGHPSQIYHFKAYSLLNYLSAAIWLILPNAKALSGIINFLFLFLSTFVPFALTLALTGRPLWGYLAATMTVSGSLTLFRGSYPIYVFPEFAHHGHIGLHFALLAVAFLLADHRKIAGFLFGLLPSVHLVLALFLGPFVVWHIRKEKSRREFTFFAIAGLLISAILAVIIHFVSSRGGVPEFPASSIPQANTILQNFISFTDHHRRPFEILSLGYLVGPVAFFTVAFICLSSKQSRNQLEEFRSVQWVVLIASVCWTVMYGTRILQGVTGTAPLQLQRIMPYRLTSVTVLLVTPLAFRTLETAFRTFSARDRLSVLTLIICLLIVGSATISAEKIPVSLPLILIGIVFATCAFADRGHWRSAFLNVACAGLLQATVLITTPKGWSRAALPASYLGSYLFLYVHQLLNKKQSAGRWNLVATAVLAAFCFSIAGTALLNERQKRPLSQFENHDQISSWLAKHGKPNELILPSVDQGPGLQVFLGHPILAECSWLWNMIYVTQMAPEAARLTRELYGVDYGDREKLKQLRPNGRVPLLYFGNKWEEFELSKWMQLSKQFNFRFVLCHPGIKLNLPIEIVTPNGTLYSIPSEIQKSRS